MPGAEGDENGWIKWDCQAALAYVLISKGLVGIGRRDDRDFAGAVMAYALRNKSDGYRGGGQIGPDRAEIGVWAVCACPIL